MYLSVPIAHSTFLNASLNLFKLNTHNLDSLRVYAQLF